MKKSIVKSKIEHLVAVDQTKHIIKHSTLLLIKQSSPTTMDGYHYSSSDDSSDSSDSSAIEWSDNDFDMMAVAVLLLVNSNIAVLNGIPKKQITHRR